MSYRQIPSYNWLRVFEAAARHQSFTRAAEQLAMSSAAVSQQIKALETHLKQPLFERGPHSVALTDAGKAFFPVVQQSLRSIETTAAALFGNPVQKPLSILGSLMFICSWLAPRLHDFQQRYPRVHLQISTTDSEDTALVEQKDLQISFGSGPLFKDEGDRLFGEALYPVAVPRIANKVNTINELLQYQLIEIGSHRNSWFQILSQENDVHISEARFCFADNTLVAINMAASGLGVALARAPASDELCKQCGVIPCLEGFSVVSPQEYYLIYPSLPSMSEAARAFRSWLLEQIADQSCTPYNRIS